MSLTFGSLFAGIGGLDLGLERAGMVCKWQVESDEWCKKVLAKHWPHVKRFGDIRDVGKHNLETVDLICGGFPCQPFSNAGQRLGQADDRFLWPEMLRIMQELKPRWVIGENVTGFIGLYLDQALVDLESQGYEAWTVILPAVAFDAPHVRKRVFILAYAGYQQQQGRENPEKSSERKARGQFASRGSFVADASIECQRKPANEANALTVGEQARNEPGNGGQPLADTDGGRIQRAQNEVRTGGNVAELGGKDLADSNGKRQQQPQGAIGQERGRPGHSSQDVENATSGRKREYQEREGSEGSQYKSEQSSWWSTEPDVGRVANGIPNRVDRLRGLGNAVVPQVAEHIARMILEIEANL